MKIITYKELGEYIGKQASEYFDKWYSYDIKDYEDDIYKMIKRMVVFNKMLTLSLTRCCS